MHVDKRLDDLIEAGWHVVDSEFDCKAVCFWKEKVADLFCDLLGPDDECTRGFREAARRFEESVCREHLPMRPPPTDRPPPQRIPRTFLDSLGA